LNGNIATILGVCTVFIKAIQAGDEFTYQLKRLFKFDVFKVLGLDQHQNIIYPNPPKGTIRITNFDPMDKVSILDLNGRERKTSISFEGALDVSSFESGTYFILVKRNGLLNTFQFVKE